MYKNNKIFQHTVNAKSSNHLHSVLQTASRLESATIWVDVNMPHRPLDANAQVWCASGVGVQNIHKVGIVRGETP